MVGKLGQIHLLQVLHGQILGLFALDALHLQSEHNVLLHGEPGEQGVLLEDHAALGAGAGDLLAFAVDSAGSGLVEAGDDVEQGRLTAAGGAYHADEFVLIDVQVHPVQGYHLAVAGIVYLADVIDLDDQISLFSCHPVSFLSKNLMIFSRVIPMMPMMMT